MFTYRTSKNKIKILKDFMRESAQKMLKLAIEAEVEEFLEKMVFRSRDTDPLIFLYKMKYKIRTKKPNVFSILLSEKYGR